MIPWIQVYSNLVRHPKVTNLADKLNLTSKDVGPNVVAAGMLVSLWLWAAQNATDGDLSECSDRAIAEAAEFKRKPSLFVEALISAKLLDEDRKLHDWDEYATLLIECDDQQREKTRQRVARHRANKKALKEAKSNAECNGGCNVTDTPGNAPTIPYNTIPNQTIQNLSGGAGDNRAGVREASDSELWSIGIAPGEYPPIHQDRVRWVRATTQRLFDKYRTGVDPRSWDFRKVFDLAYAPEMADVLDYAFEKAAIAGKVDDWRYIEGIMIRLHARGIATVAEARAYDTERPDLEEL